MLTRVHICRRGRQKEYHISTLPAKIFSNETASSLIHSKRAQVSHSITPSPHSIYSYLGNHDGRAAVIIVLVSSGDKNLQEGLITYCLQDSWMSTGFDLLHSKRSKLMNVMYVCPYFWTNAWARKNT
jgi:hypothetical protein